MRDEQDSACFVVSTGRHKNIYTLAILEEDVQREGPS